MPHYLTRNTYLFITYYVLRINALCIMYITYDFWLMINDLSTMTYKEAIAWWSGNVGRNCENNELYGLIKEDWQELRKQRLSWINCDQTLAICENNGNHVLMITNRWLELRKQRESWFDDNTTLAGIAKTAKISVWW